MPVEGNKKQPRVPLSSEQLKEVIIFKHNKQVKAIEKLKKTWHYKILNIFNIICVFVYCEMIFCMYGPALYHPLVCTKANVDEFNRGTGSQKDEVTFLSVWDQYDNRYQLYVADTIQKPQPNSTFYVGEDFLLRKEVKAMVNTSQAEYRLWRVIPLVFLGISITLITFLAFTYHMNMVNYSLIAVSVMNALNLMYFIVI
jgi:hypothetical protein